MIGHTSIIGYHSRDVSQFPGKGPDLKPQGHIQLSTLAKFPAESNVLHFAALGIYDRCLQARRRRAGGDRKGDVADDSGDLT